MLNICKSREGSILSSLSDALVSNFAQKKRKTTANEYKLVLTMLIITANSATFINNRAQFMIPTTSFLESKLLYKCYSTSDVFDLVVTLG